MSTASSPLDRDDPTVLISRAGSLLGQLAAQPLLVEPILNQLPTGLLICNVQGDIVFLNTAAKRLAALDPAPASAAAFFAALGQDVSCSNGENALWTLAEALPGETLTDRETCIVRPDGTYLYLLVSRNPLKDVQGVMIGAVLTCVDITEQKVARQRLQDMQHAQTVAQTGNWRLDVSHNRLVWSDETYRIFGIARDTPLTYEIFLAHIHPMDRDYVNESWLAALQGEPYDLEHRIVVGTQVKWVRERAELEFDDQGALYGGFGTVQDITRRKQAEAELRSVARFPSENPNPVLRVSVNGAVIYANEASRPVLSAWDSQAGPLLPLPWHDILSRSISSGQTQELEVEGSGRSFLLQFVPIANHDYVNIYGRDITTRKRAQERQHLLQDLVVGLALALTPGEIATTVIEKGIQATGASGGAVALLNHNTDPTLHLIGALGYPPSVVDSWRCFSLDSPSPLLALAARTRRPIFYETLEERQTCAPLPPDIPTDGLQAGAALPIMIQGRVLGALCFSFPPPRAFEELERRFLIAIADYCAQALERSRLGEQAMEAAALRERQRFARDLHDAVSQVLFASTMIAEAVPRLWEHSREKTAEYLDQLVTLNHAAMAEMRGLLLELRPETIDRTSLETLLKQLVAAAKGRRRIHAILSVEGEDISLGPDVMMTFYRIAQESINNILKHSQATGFEILLQQEAQHILLSIVDNGRGFVPDLVSAPGVGLQFMCERAQAIGAALDIDSCPGEGTRVTVRWTADGTGFS